MVSNTEKFAPFAERMRRAEMPEVVIRTFEHYYGQLAEGHTGLIREEQLVPVGPLPDLETLPAHLDDVGVDALNQTVLLKLNGGLGTSMGLEGAKSLLPVKDGLSFLDIIARQARHVRIPLVLMNSFSTREESLKVLRNYPDLWGKLPIDFLQHKVPKIVQKDLSPATWPKDPELEWCPPGHGDLYTALFTSGMLDRMLKEGYRYAFVSNADNLGAVIDTTLLGYFAENRLPFMMEVANRTPADKKGGHLGRLASGQLILRESAQCPPEDMEAFQDINRHSYFNTNNLWLNLPALHDLMLARDYILGLPMIRNTKTVDPRDPASTPVYQLETAMGAAIGVFEGAGAVRVPRDRFAPVKTTDDLLAVRSDAYTLTDDFRIVVHPARTGGPVSVELDSNYYKLIDQLEDRFPYGPPSLIACERMTVEGDIRFGQNVVLKGAVRMINASDRQVQVEDGALIEGDWQRP